MLKLLRTILSSETFVASGISPLPKVKRQAHTVTWIILCNYFSPFNCMTFSFYCVNVKCIWFHPLVSCSIDGTFLRFCVFHVFNLVLVIELSSHSVVLYSETIQYACYLAEFDKRYLCYKKIYHSHKIHLALYLFTK